MAEDRFKAIAKALVETIAAVGGEAWLRKECDGDGWPDMALLYCTAKRALNEVRQPVELSQDKWVIHSTVLPGESQPKYLVQLNGETLAVVRDRVLAQVMAAAPKLLAQVQAETVLVEQMREWAALLQAGKEPKQSIIAGLREVADDVEHQCGVALQAAGLPD